MFNHFKCTVRVCFSDSDVIDWLIENEEIEEGTNDYEPTIDDKNRYAWYCIENEYCEYGSVDVDN